MNFKKSLLALSFLLGLPVVAHAQATPSGPHDALMYYWTGTTWAPYTGGGGGGGGSSGAVYGLNGTSAMSASNPFADDQVQVGGVAISLGLKAATASYPTVDANLGLSYGSGNPDTTPAAGYIDIGGMYMTTAPTLTNGETANLQITASGQLITRDITLPNSVVTATGATAPAQAVQIAAVYNTTLPTRTAGQSGALQSDVSGQLLERDTVAETDLGNLNNTYAAGQAAAPVGEQIEGGIYNATLPTLTTGQVAQLQLSTAGQLITRDSTLPNLVVTATGAGASSQAVQIAGVYNSTLSTRTTGQGGVLQTDSSGRMLVVDNIVEAEHIASGGGIGAAYGIAPFGQYNTTLPTDTAATMNPIQIDANGRLRTVNDPTANVAQGLTSCGTTSGATATCKATAGNLYSVYVSNASVAGNLEVFNAASMPADAASGLTPVECVPVAAGGIASLNYNPIGEAFSTGIQVAFSTAAGCAAKTTTSGTAFIHGTYQ